MLLIERREAKRYISGHTRLNGFDLCVNSKNQAVVFEVTFFDNKRCGTGIGYIQVDLLTAANRHSTEIQVTEKSGCLCLRLIDQRSAGDLKFRRERRYYFLFHGQADSRAVCVIT